MDKAGRVDTLWPYPLRRKQGERPGSSYQSKVLLTLLASWFLNAAAIRAERLPVRAYNSDDGLADNHINRIRQDRHGFLWFATDDGLSRFDGVGFRNFTTASGLPHRWVNDIIQARNGEYWIATDDGICRFGSRSGFACYGPAGKDARRVNELSEGPDGALWCATYDGVYRMDTTSDPPRFYRETLPVPVMSEASLVNTLLWDRRGTLWAGSASGLYQRDPSGQWRRFDGLPHPFVHTLFEDRDGHLWAGMRHEGFCRLARDPETGARLVEQRYTVRNGLPDNDVRALIQASDGRIWIGTPAGLSQLADDGTIVTFTTRHGLTDLTVLSLMEDREGRLWAGSKHAGVMTLGRSGFTAYGEAEGFRTVDDAAEILETSSGLLCVACALGTGRSLQCLKDGRFFSISFPLDPTLGSSGWHWHERLMQDRDGGWWLPTGQGLFRYAAAPTSAPPRPFLSSLYRFDRAHIGRLYQDSNGNIWIPASISYSPELFRWKRATNSLERLTEVTHSEGMLASSYFTDSAGRFWIGFRGEGRLVRCLDDSPRNCEPVSTGLRGDIFAMRCDRAGRLWIGTYGGGVGRCDRPDVVHPEFISYTTASGLSSDEVWTLAEDLSGRIYIGTGKGLDRLDPGTGRIRHFTPEDGIGAGRVQAAHRDRSGALWFATSRGVSRLEPQLPHGAPPIARITGLRISGVQQPWPTSGVASSGPVKLGPSDNTVEIEFVGLHFDSGTRLRYQYLLEDSGGDWSALTTARTAAFPRLPAGTHRFQVRAVDADGEPSEPAALTFSVTPPLWRRSWFLCLACLAGASAFWSFHRYRLAQALELERIRRRIATDLHDDLGSSLSRIAILSEVAKRQLGPIPGTDRLLEDIASSARAMVDSMSDIVWSIDPRSDSLSSLVARVREFASGLLDAQGIQWDCTTSPRMDLLTLNPNQRHQLYLIFKEAIANGARHAGCRAIRLSLEIDGAQLIARIADDGCGIPADSRPGHGLSSIRARAELLRGECDIATAPRQGTSITLKLPLNRRRRRA